LSLMHPYMFRHLQCHSQGDVHKDTEIEQILSKDVHICKHSLALLIYFSFAFSLFLFTSFLQTRFSNVNTVFTVTSYIPHDYLFFFLFLFSLRIF
jgi:hypothetical protein